jgi:hypothetical protein
MRIDIIDADQDLARRIHTTWIDHLERKADRPSDHAASSPTSISQPADDPSLDRFQGRRRCSATADGLSTAAMLHKCFDEANENQV